MAKEAVQLIEMAQSTIRTLLIDKQIPADLSQQIAIDVTNQLRAEWGGTTIYFPKMTCLTPRNNAIIKEFDGTNVKALSRKHKLSEAFIYELLRKSREPLPSTAKA